MNANEYLTMAAMTKQYHLSSGHCASYVGSTPRCCGVNTTYDLVKGRVRAAGYNSSRRAVTACHKYEETMQYWTAQYIKALGYKPEYWVLENRNEQARRERYERVSA